MNWPFKNKEKKEKKEKFEKPSIEIIYMDEPEDIIATSSGPSATCDLEELLDYGECLDE